MNLTVIERSCRFDISGYLDDIAILIHFTNALWCRFEFWHRMLLPPKVILLKNFDSEQ